MNQSPWNHNIASTHLVANFKSLTITSKIIFRVILLNSISMICITCRTINCVRKIEIQIIKTLFRITTYMNSTYITEYVPTKPIHLSWTLPACNKTNNQYPSIHEIPEIRAFNKCQFSDRWRQADYELTTNDPTKSNGRFLLDVS